MKKMLLALCAAITASVAQASPARLNDAQAYSLCKADKTSYIAIVWPIAQGKDESIEKLFRKYGSLKYKKIVYFKPDQSAMLLHDAHPHITNIKEHVTMYFPSSHIYKQPARIYLVTFKDLDTAVACKLAIRRLFNLGYSSIHITDYHYEAIKLAEFFYASNHHRSIVATISFIEFLERFGDCLKNQ